VDWEIEAEFENETEARQFLSFLKTTVPRILTSKGNICSKTVNAGTAPPLRFPPPESCPLCMLASAADWQPFLSHQ
jgi:hypothetical protein